MQQTPKPQRTGPFVKLPTSVLHRPELSDRAVRLYAVLADMQGRNANAWPHRSTLAAALGCSVSSVDRALRELGELVTIRHRFDSTGAQIGSAYFVQTGSRVTCDEGPSSPVTRGPSHPRRTEPDPLNQIQGTTVLGLGVDRHQPDTHDTDFDISAAVKTAKQAIRRNR